MNPLIRFDSEIEGEQHAVLYTEITHISPSGDGIGSIVNLRCKDWYRSPEPAHKIQARWKGFYVTKQSEEKEASKTMQECPFESDINYDLVPEFSAWWNRNRGQFKSDTHYMSHISEMIIYVAAEAWISSKEEAK